MKIREKIAPYQSWSLKKWF